MYRDLCRPLLRRLHTKAVTGVVKTRACHQPLDRRSAKDVPYTFSKADFGNTEFINSTNNSVSGVISLMHAGDLEAGSSCTANGFLGQFSVQVSLLKSFGKLTVVSNNY